MINENEIRTKYFPYLELGDHPVSEAGYFPIFVCYFDHILSAEEMDSINFRLIHETAERSFVRVYARLMEKMGAYVLTDGHVPKEYFSSFSKMDQKFDDIIVRSMRDQESFQAYFPDFQVRVISAYDLTDIWLLRDKKKMEIIKDIVRESGLFILPADHLA